MFYNCACAEFNRLIRMIGTGTATSALKDILIIIVQLLRSVVGRKPQHAASKSVDHAIMTDHVLPESGVDITFGMSLLLQISSTVIVRSQEYTH